MSKIVEKALQKINQPNLLETLSTLSGAELNSVLLEVLSNHTEKLTPNELLKNYKSNRFVTPSNFDASSFYKLQAKMTDEAEKNGIHSVLLSPVAPLGSCSAFGYVHQNNIMSATRNSEVLSDSSNMLALYIANKIKSKEITNGEPIHYCSTDRLTRTQFFGGPHQTTHFGLFCIVSSTKDKGSYKGEIELLTKQLEFIRSFLKDNYNAGMTVVLSKRSGYKDNEGFFNRMLEEVQSIFTDLEIKTDESDVDNNYYKGINYKIYMNRGDEQLEIGDGGFTDWTQTMLNNKKERLLISGIGMERLLLLDD